MRILRNYILKEVAGTFIFAIFMLLFLFLAGRGIMQMADLVINKGISIFLVLKMLFLTLPFLVVFVIPMAALLSILLGLGKLSHDNEITALHANGLSLGRIVAPILTASLVLCLTALLVYDRFAPSTHYAYRKLLTEVGLQSPLAALEEGVFIKKFKNFIIYVYEIDKNKLKGIRIYQPQEGKPTRTIVAQKGEVITIPETHTVKIKLIQGTSDEPDPKDPSKLYKLNFKTYDLPLNLSDFTENYEPPDKKPKEMSIRELYDEIDRLHQAGVHILSPLWAEIHNKIALSFSSLAFVLVGIPLALTIRRRSEKSVGFVLSLAVLMVYWLCLIAGKALAQKGVVPAFPALQFSNFLVGGIGIYLMMRHAKN